MPCRSVEPVNETMSIGGRRQLGGDFVERGVTTVENARGMSVCSRQPAQ